MFMVKSVDNFLSKEENDKILQFAKEFENWENIGNGFWDGRCLTAQNVYKSHNKEIGELLYDIRIRTQDKIKELYKIENVYADLTQLIRWFDGMEQPVHADDMTNAGPGYEWFNHRHFGTIIYLNDDYDGGKTYYPQYNFEITPKSGMLAIHPGDTDHFHGVTKITGNTRYTIASFWTKDEGYHDGWTIHK